MSGQTPQVVVSLLLPETLTVDLVNIDANAAPQVANNLMKQAATKIDKLSADLSEAVAALKALTDDAIVLSPDYLAAFETEPLDATIQGWSKFQWVRLLDTWNKARSIVARME